MVKILNKKIVSINRIYIVEEGEEYKIHDSILLVSNDNEKFQIQTSQKNLFVYGVKKIRDVNIDGEYEIEDIFIKEITKSDNFYVSKIHLFWNKEKEYILGFKISNNDKNICFIRLVDEIIKTTELDFDNKLNKIECFIEELNLTTY